MKYLDPKADLTFKKIFGRHPDLLTSLLNALLPLGADEEIQSIEYLQTELVSVLYEHKNSIVDVLCEDIRGRKFCVEMQMEWTTSFKQRVLFNASKLYVTQAEQRERYSELKPVYSLNLVNDIFEPGLKDYIHNYKIVHDKYSDKVIEGLHFTFIELPKFTPHSIAEKRMAVLWLRFLTEIDSSTKTIPAELLDSPEISRALEEVEITAFSDEELRAYDKFWDTVRTEKTLRHDSYQEGLADGRAEGMAAGREEAMRQMARKLLAMGSDISGVASLTGLGEEQVLALKEKGKKQ